MKIQLAPWIWQSGWHHYRWSSDHPGSSPEPALPEVQGGSSEILPTWVTAQPHSALQLLSGVEGMQPGQGSQGSQGLLCSFRSRCCGSCR